jgi:exodeoxyribonuclease V beta subunit
MREPEFWNDLSLDPCVHLIEASAGTGKTYGITALVVRLVAAGVPIERLLVVTFTRAATAELRDRVRRRLADAVRALDRHAAGAAEDDAFLRAFAADPGGDRAEVRRRLREAEARFDQAVIATIHSFCQQAQSWHAFETGAELGGELIPDASLLLEEIVDDLLVARRHGVDAALCRVLAGVWDRGLLARVARAATADLEMAILPEAAPDAASQALLEQAARDRGGAAELGLAERRALDRELGAFARAARRELRDRCARRGLLTYDDLVRGLADAVLDPARRAPVTAALRARFDVALIDEFQDTDARQWRIFRGVFDAPDRSLYLIGDPKQAIYNFRGANLDVYHAAKASAAADRRRSLPENFRSDWAFVAGLNHLMSRPPAFFADERAGFAAVTARARATRLRLPAGTPPAACAPLQLRLFAPPDDPGAFIESARALQLVPELVASEIVDLLESGARLPAPSDDGQAADRAVRPGDLAVLVRTHDQAAAVQAALTRRAVPAVVGGSGNIFQTEETTALRRWLAALESPRSGGAARAAAALPMFAWEARHLERPEAAEAADPEADLRWAAWIE